MQQWKIPPVIKVYEALGAIADGRVKMTDKNHATVASSEGTKVYDVFWDSRKKAIMANDNGSYWVGYLEYPSIAFLMMLGVLPYDEKGALILKEIPWKAMNKKHKNDFEKTMEEIFSSMLPEQQRLVENFGNTVLREIESLLLVKLGKRKKPPLDK